MKRKLLSLTLAAVLTLSLVTALPQTAVADDPPGPSAPGTAGNPHLVRNAAALRQVGSGTPEGWTMSAHYKQTADIDLSGFDNWLPIGGNGDSHVGAVAFTGVYDGGGYVISNLTINRPGNAEANYDTYGYIQGLFNTIRDGGVVKNLGLEDVNIRAHSYTGGIAGVNSRGTISNCYVTGKITRGNSSGQNFGGIVGENSGVVEYCYSTAEIDVLGSVGGIAGQNLAGTIQYSVALNTSVKTQAAFSEVFRIAKKASSSDGPTVFTENYALDTMVLRFGDPSAVKTAYLIEEDGHNITAEQVKKPETWIALKWDFDNTWEIKRNADRPTFQTGGNVHNIAYTPLEALVTATPAKDAAHSADENTYTADSAIIDLVAEELTLPTGFTAAAFSTDGGEKWKNGAPPDLVKLLNKDLILHVSNLEIDRATKKPPAGKEAEGEAAAVAGATIIEFAKITGRPRVTKLAINYAIYAADLAETPGQWALAAKGATTVSDTVSDLQIAVAAANKKDPDDEGWGRFRAAQGINVLHTEAGVKPTKTIYLVRGAPKGGNDGSAVAAAKPYKITASSQLVQPKLKVNYKLENIKPKVGMSLSGTGIETVVYAKASPALKGVPIGTAIGETEGNVLAWMTATAKKPASRIQSIALAPRAALPTEPEEVPAPGGKIKLPSKWEIFNATSNKWGGVPALTASVTTIENVRLKATAKADKPGTGYTDLAASADGTIHIYWGKNNRGGDAVLAAWFLAPGMDPPDPPEDIVIDLPDDSDPPVITGQPQPTTITQHSEDKFLTVTATGSGTLSYRWYLDNKMITDEDTTYTGGGLATLSLSRSLPLGEYSFYVRVTNKEAGKNATSLVSSTVKVIVQAGSALPNITSHPVATTTATAGSIGDLQLVVTANGSGTLSYQWYSTNATNSNAEPIDGEKDRTFTIPTTLTAGTYYYFVRVTNTESGKPAVVLDSHVSTVTITPPAP